MRIHGDKQTEVKLSPLISSGKKTCTISEHVNIYTTDWPLPFLLSCVLSDTKAGHLIYNVLGIIVSLE